MWRSQAEAEGLTLRVADNKTGYFGVQLDQRAKTKPYQARVTRGGKKVTLGCFATAEEAALCVARTPEGQEAAKRPAAAAPLTSEEARQQAEAEGLTLLVADNATGYLGVRHNPGRPKPYEAQVRRGGKMVHLGCFATAEEAALCVARTPEGREAAKRPAAALPLTGEEARQQARAEGLTLRVADNKTGYFGVHLDQRAKTKPYAAQVTRGGKHVSLGTFATAEEAALCVARSPEGRAAAGRAAALTSEEVGRRRACPLRRKGLSGRREQVPTALGARSAEEEAEEAAAEEEAEMELVEAVEVVGEEAEEAEAAVVEVWDVVEAEAAEAEAEDVQQMEVVEVAEGRPKRRRKT